MSSAATAPPDTAALARRAQSNACLQALPASAFTRVPVFIYGEVVDSLDRASRPSVDMIAQVVAQRLRIALWRSPAAADSADAAGRLAPADSLFGQTALSGGVRLTVRRGGAVTWRVTTPPGTAAPDSVAGQLLARAVATARDSMELFVPDDAFRGDSLVFDLEHVHAEVDADTRALTPVRRRNPAPAFTLPVAPERGARPNGSLPLRYPAELQWGGFQGHVIVSFVVDTMGRAEMGTFRDVHPEVARALKPHLRGAYATFVGAVRDAVRRARYFPAEVGACRVRQLVQQPASFTLTP